MERNPDAIFWIALGLVLGVVLLAAALGPRGDEEVRLGNKAANPPQEARVDQSEAPEDSSGQPALEDYSSQPAPTDTVPTETAPTDTVPTKTVDTSAQPAPAELLSAQQPIPPPPRPVPTDPVPEPPPH